jgi:hypothetical protein
MDAVSSFGRKREEQVIAGVKNEVSFMHTGARWHHIRQADVIYIGW